MKRPGLPGLFRCWLAKIGIAQLTDLQKRRRGRKLTGHMRIATLLAALLFLGTSSTALAATRAIKFGKLVDGLGRVFTNAVVIVEDDRVRSVASGSPSIPIGAEVIDLSRYTGIPGLIDAHTHITYYWDGMTVPRSEPPRHTAITVFLAQENAQQALEAGLTTIRNLNAADGADLQEVADLFFQNGVTTRALTAADVFYPLKSKVDATAQVQSAPTKSGN